MDDLTRPASHVILDRRVPIGRTTYRVAATQTGDDRIDVTVSGLDPGGGTVAEVTADIAPAALSDTAGVLSSTLAALAAMLPPPPADHPRRGGRWTPDDDARLIRLHRGGASGREMMRELGRSRGGIRLRLERLGEIPPQMAAA